jgi:hypothetical protein
MVQGADYLRGLGYSEAQIAALRPNTVIEFHPEKGGYTIREPNRYQPEIPEWLKVQGSGNDLLVQPSGFVSGWSQAPTVSPAEMQTFISSGGAGVEAEREQERLAFAEAETVTREIPTSFGAAGTTTMVQVPTKQNFVSPFKPPVPFKEQIRRSLQDYGGGAYSQGFQYTYPETLGSQRRYAAGADLTPVFDKKQLAEAAINKMSAYEFQQMKEKQAQIATEQKAFKKEYAPLAKEWAALEKKYPGKELPEELYVPYMREFTKLQAETKAVEQKFLGIEAKRLSYQGKYYSELEAFKTFGEAGVPITPQKSTETFKTGSLIVPGSPWAQPPFAEKGFDLKKIASSKFKEWKGWDLGKQEKQTVIGSNFDVRTMFSKENWNKQNTGVTIPGGLKSTRNIDVKKAFNLEEMGWVKYESPLGFEWSGERIEAASAGQKSLAAATGVGMMFVLPAASAYAAGSLSGLATYGVQTGAFIGAAAVLPQFNEEALKAFAPGREEGVYDIGAEIIALAEAYAISKGATYSYTKFVKPRFETMLFGKGALIHEYGGPFGMSEQKGQPGLFHISGQEITRISEKASHPKLAALWWKTGTKQIPNITEKFISEEFTRNPADIKPTSITMYEKTVPELIMKDAKIIFVERAKGAGYLSADKIGVSKYQFKTLKDAVNFENLFGTTMPSPDVVSTSYKAWYDKGFVSWADYYKGEITLAPSLGGKLRNIKTGILAKLPTIEITRGGLKIKGKSFSGTKFTELFGKDTKHYVDIYSPSSSSFTFVTRAPNPKAAWMDPGKTIRDPLTGITRTKTQVPTTALGVSPETARVYSPWLKGRHVSGEFFLTEDIFNPSKITGFTYTQTGFPKENPIKYKQGMTTFFGGSDYESSSRIKYTAIIEKGTISKMGKELKVFYTQSSSGIGISPADYKAWYDPTYFSWADYYKGKVSIPEAWIGKEAAFVPTSKIVNTYSGKVSIDMTTHYGTELEKAYGIKAWGTGKFTAPTEFFYKGAPSEVYTFKPGANINYILWSDVKPKGFSIKSPADIAKTPLSKTFGATMGAKDLAKELNDISSGLGENLSTISIESQNMKEMLMGHLSKTMQKVFVPAVATTTTKTGYVSGASAAVASYFQIGATTKPKGKLSAPSQITVPAFSISQIEKQLQKQVVIPQIGITTAPGQAEEVTEHQQQREAERPTISEIIGEIATEITTPIEIVTPIEDIGTKITPVQGITPGTIERITERTKIEDLDIVDLFNMPPPIPPTKQPPTFIPTMKFGGFKMPKMPKQGKGYNVFAKVSGKFQKLNKMPLIKEYAMGLGAKFVEETTAATFKITSTPYKGMKMIGISKFRPERFRAPKRRGFQMPSIGTFIEKSKYRIDMPKEFAGITYKGLAALKAKRSNIMLIGLPKARHNKKRKHKRR